MTSNNIVSVFSRIVLLALLLFSSTQSIANEAHEWVRKMSGAIHTLNYTGTFVHIHNGELDTMSIAHRVDADGERERLFSLNGEAREILRDSDQVRCILPANRSVVIGKRNVRSGLPTLMLTDVDDLLKSYDIELIGRDRIAGLPTVIITILPKDKMRYGYRLWLEADSGMVLRSDTMDIKGNMIEQMMFTEISLQSPVSVAMVESTVPHEGFNLVGEDSDEPVQESVTHSGWSFDSVPKGFSVTSQLRKRMPMKRHQVEHYILSDGLAVVSVYIEQSNNGKTELEGPSQMGSVNAYGRVINGHKITVLGEVPQSTARAIANAVSMKK
ncbi:MAG: hypothetical protein EP297_10725 [Gammaproteobacteria bacterium]|nr:MAG: hypothetical protein EP297_10725 [Gammaproteobacteria bacterium]